jgi:hypothetical protein
LQQAIDDQLRGLELAAVEGDPLMITLANLALAKSYRLLGETYSHLHEDDQAQQFLALTREKVEATLEPLRAAGQIRLLAQAYEVQGAAYLQEADLLRERDPTVAQALLTNAAEAYAFCITQGRQIVDAVLTDGVIGAGCQRNADLTATYLEELKGN